MVTYDGMYCVNFVKCMMVIYTVAPGALNFTTILTEASILVEWQVKIILLILNLCQFVYSASTTDNWFSSPSLCCVLQYQ